MPIGRASLLFLVIGVFVAASTPGRIVGQGLNLRNTTIEIRTGLNTSEIEAETAERVGLSAHPVGGGVGVGLRFAKFLGVRLGVSMETPKDLDPFETEVVVVPGTGSSVTASSKTLIWHTSASAGLRLPIIRLQDDPWGWEIRLGAGLGFNSIGGKRFISNCRGCRSRPIEIQGGRYYEPSVDVIKQMSNGNFAGISIVYRHFQESADVSFRLLITFVWGHDIGQGDRRKQTAIG